MELLNPLAVVTPTLDGPVLRVVSAADAEFTTGDVVGLIGHGSHRGVRLVLDRLTQQGIVDRRLVGRAWTYRFNRDHIAAAAVMELSDLRGILLSRLRDDVSSWSEPPVYAAMFGSAVTGGHGVTSDIDVFLVRPQRTSEIEWDHLVAGLMVRATRWSGNDTRPVVVDEEEITAWVRRGERLIADVMEHGASFYGDPGWLKERAQQVRTPG